MLFVTAPVYRTFISPNAGMLSITVALFITSLVRVVFDCTFLFIHLCYYIISRNIQLVLWNPISHAENESKPSNEQVTSNNGYIQSFSSLDNYYLKYNLKTAIYVNDW